MGQEPTINLPSSSSFSAGRVRSSPVTLAAQGFANYAGKKKSDYKRILISRIADECMICQENDDDVVLVLELPQNDPLFMRKKKLLDDKGFALKIHAPLKCSSVPTLDQLNDFSNRLIQQARIINYDEVEIYFNGDSASDYSNPRNELQALNYLLEAIDNSLSGDKHMMKNIMQNLRDEIVDRIHKVGSRFGEELEFVGCSNTDKEKCLLDWSVNNGARTNLDIAYIEGAGRGAIATQDLKVGDIALEIPVSIIISEELVHESNLFHVLNEINGISTETMLLLWCMREKYNKNSRFILFFETLPEKFNTGLSFGVDALVTLDGTLLLEEILQAKEHLRVQYEELFPALSDLHPDVFPPDLYTWEHFLWACELFYSNSMKVFFTDGKLRTCLIPVAGFLNHSVCPHVLRYGRIEASTHTLRFPLSRACHAGEQCFLAYGKFSSSHLLTFYGFLPQEDNPYDVIPLEFDNLKDEDCEDGRIATEVPTHMVRGTWYSKDHGIFQYGLPSPLLDILRRAGNPNWQSSVITKEILETELIVLRDLKCTFQDMMDALGDENVDDRASWDVKLAIEYKNLQRRILSSILTSCGTGFELVECELLKCTS
ncbi:SET domain-containing protein [Dorcoceras hygrometricum]|uniref:SET domain-containing protein n=1 Tax=Dorcoceras hygrometricum TaxID=472368 RepID=A0A2Z7BJ39_9LAMI|nr:SET domain-containing protein [Dorcoceras hygrometricum]